MLWLLTCSMCDFKLTHGKKSWKAYIREIMAWDRKENWQWQRCSSIFQPTRSEHALFYKVHFLKVLCYRFIGPAAAAKSLQFCPILCDPIDGSPPGSPVPGILQTRILERVAISFSNAWKWKVKVKSLSLVQLFETPWTVACQAPPSMGFSRQEYWSGVPLPSPTCYERNCCFCIISIYYIVSQTIWIETVSTAIMKHLVLYFFFINVDHYQ